VVNYKKALLPQKNRTMCYASRNLVNWCITVGKQTHLFNGPLSGTTQVSWYQKGKDNLDFTKARDSEWQWHQLGHMQACTSLQTDNHASTPPRFFTGWMPFCHPTNSVKALKATVGKHCTTNTKQTEVMKPYFWRYPNFFTTQCRIG